MRQKAGGLALSGSALTPRGPVSTHAVLAGQLHPACRITGAGRDSLRLPCFVLGAHQLVLPAFGEFTGGWRVAAAEDRCLYPLGEGQVWRLPGSDPVLKVKLPD